MSIATVGIQSAHRPHADRDEAPLYLSVSQNELGNFHLRRGRPADANRALEYVKAAAQTLERLLQRGKAGPEALQQLVTHHWNVAAIAQQVEGASDEVQQACARSHQLLRAMQENDIPLDQNCERILARLNQMVSGGGQG